MICHSCFKDVKSGKYCSKCRKDLFSGRDIQPLSFNKEEFYEHKREMTNRMSLSGVQDKISLKFGDDGHLIPTATNGEYILKPIPRTHESAINLEDISANEHLSMQLSSQVFKIPTAYNGLIAFSDGELAYITKRFDYSLDSNEKKIIKLDQEDFASVLQYTKASNGDDYKYESSYEACANNIKKFVAAKKPALEDFYKRVVLNYLIGNADAHLKNFSLIREVSRTDYSLSPNYDILYTKYHLPKEDGIMALDLFDEYESEAFGAMGYYTLQDFEELATICEITPKRLNKIFADIFKSRGEVKNLIKHSFLSNRAKEEYEDAYYTRLEKSLFYSIKSYPFRGVTQKTIDSFLN